MSMVPVVLQITSTVSSANTVNVMMELMAIHCTMVSLRVSVVSLTTSDLIAPPEVFSVLSSCRHDPLSQTCDRSSSDVTVSGMVGSVDCWVVVPMLTESIWVLNARFSDRYRPVIAAASMSRDTRAILMVSLTRKLVGLSACGLPDCRGVDGVVDGAVMGCGIRVLVRSR